MKNALMIVKFSTSFYLLAILASCSSPTKDPYNLSFEELDSLSIPVGWTFSNPVTTVGITEIDPLIHHAGKYSIKMTKTSGSGFPFIKTIIPAPASGKTAHLTGYLKTGSITDGFGSLWIRIEDKNGKILAFKNMGYNGVKGTSDWRPYSLAVGFDPKAANKIYLGALLSGTGTLWVDDLHFTITDDSVAGNFNDPAAGTPATRNTTYATDIRIASAALSAQHYTTKIHEFALVGKIWGFLKYYHPAVEAGKLDWDSVLFTILPKIGRDAPARYDRLFEAILKDLGTVPPCTDCKTATDAQIKMGPRFGGLFKEKLPGALMEKLAFLRDNHKSNPKGFYAEIADRIGNPSFGHEVAYGNDPYPPAALRLLSLFRYWNIIEYYYPYRYATREDWDAVLTAFIPRVLGSRNTGEYLLTCLDLIGRIHDSHAYLALPIPSLDSLKGNYMMPFQAKFIQNKLAVTGYYIDPQKIAAPLSVGDIIEKIDGVPVDSLVSHYLPFTPGSNRSVQLRDLTSVQGFLLRSHKDSADLDIFHNGKKHKIKIQSIPLEASFRTDFLGIATRPAFELLPGNIGYINPGKLTDRDFDTIKVRFQHTRGLIIDLRCYPSTFMPFTFGSWLKPSPSPFASFTATDPRMPGTFIHTATVSNGAPVSNAPTSTRDGSGIYQGKLIIIVNSTTQSQAEYTAMALRTTSGSVIIGSTTAGADGNLSTLNLPGSIATAFSGTGVYYPDGSETQRTGIKIDIPVEPTLAGIAQGKDEYLELALKLLK